MTFQSLRLRRRHWSLFVKDLNSSCQGGSVSARAWVLGCLQDSRTGVRTLAITIYSQASSCFGLVFYGPLSWKYEGVLARKLKPTELLYTVLPWFLDLWRSTWPGQKCKMKHTDVSIQEIRVDDEVRGGNVQAKWCQVFRKIVAWRFQNGPLHTDSDILSVLSSVSSQVDEYCFRCVWTSQHIT